MATILRLELRTQIYEKASELTVPQLLECLKQSPGISISGSIMRVVQETKKSRKQSWEI